jgi:hypothetical protein
MSGDYLRRYTDLTALIYLLRNSKLTLLDPNSWDDSNDSYYLTLYREKRKLKSVLALCFTETDERYHYWRVFASGASGVCIRFNRSGLAAAVQDQLGLQMKRIGNGPARRCGATTCAYLGSDRRLTAHLHAPRMAARRPKMSQAAQPESESHRLVRKMIALKMNVGPVATFRLFLGLLGFRAWIPNKWISWFTVRKNRLSLGDPPQNLTHQ